MELKYWDSMKYIEEQLEKAKKTLPTPNDDILSGDALADILQKEVNISEPQMPDEGNLTFDSSVVEANEEQPVIPPISEDELCLSTDLDLIENNVSETEMTLDSADSSDMAESSYTDKIDKEADNLYTDKIDEEAEENGKIIRLPIASQKTASGFHMSPLQVIIAIFVGIPVGIPLFGISVTFFGVLAAILITLTVSCAAFTIAGLAGGLAAVIFGIVTVFTNTIAGILAVGVGLVALGIGFLFIFPTGFFPGKGIPAVASGLSTVCDKLINVFI